MVERKGFEHLPLRCARGASQPELGARRGEVASAGQIGHFRATATVKVAKEVFPMAIVDGGYVSADGHVVEPADLWTKRIDK